MSDQPSDSQPGDPQEGDAQSGGPQSGDPQSGDVARWLRAVRRARSLSQRELAERARVPLSMISGIEGGGRSPGVARLQQILSSSGYRLAVVEADTGAPLIADDEHDAIRDRGGRRLPAHLAWGGRPTIHTAPWWWGWDHIAWGDNGDPRIPEHTWRQRPREARGPFREHPWYGRFRGRGACRGPQSQPCAGCVGDCRFEGGPTPEPGAEPGSEPGSEPAET